MSNKLTDLNASLFAQLERLSSAEGDQVKPEIERSRAVAGVGKIIIENARIALDGEKFLCSERGARLPAMLSDNSDD